MTLEGSVGENWFTNKVVCRVLMGGILAFGRTNGSKRFLFLLFSRDYILF